MGLESVPHPRVLGQTDFCQATSDWALKALASSFCRSWPFSAEVHPHCHVRGVKCKQCPVGMHQKLSGRTGFATVGVSGICGSEVWWWEMEGCKGLLLPRLWPPAPAPLPPIAQHPSGDHSYCLTWKRNSREVPTCFCCFHLKHSLASGKSTPCHVTVCCFVCNYRVPHDVICKYLFWIIFLYPTESFSALQIGCRSSLGRASPRVPQCPRWLCRHVLPQPARKGGNTTVVLPSALNIFG